MLGTGPHMLGNECHMLGNGPQLCTQFMKRVILIMGRLGWVVCLSWPMGLSNELHVLGSRPHALGNRSLVRIISLELILHSGVCHSGLCRIWDYVVFGIMLSRIMLHLGLCHIWYSVVRDYVVRDNGAWA